MNRPQLTRQPALLLSLLVSLIFFALAHKQYYQYLNYTFLIGSTFLDGHLGLAIAPTWLNELVPYGGQYYSVFPLGAVLSVLPFSWLVKIGLVSTYPVTLVVGLLAGATTYFTYALTGLRSDFTPAKRLMLTTWLVAGTWYATNLLMAGAWQLALGFAIAGELAALYWTLVRPRPLLAGLAFAVTFGNRTEILFTAPFFLALLVWPTWQHHHHEFWIRARTPLLLFCLIPFILGVTTLAYNQARFGSPADFGYARIPGILNEPLYQEGIFSTRPIHENARQMLWQGWKTVPAWPYRVPTGFGGSILLASPFLFLLVRSWRGQKRLLASSALAVVILTAVLWVHGNPGGWQYSYRYALILLPWVLVIFTQILPARITKLELGLWLLSIGISSYVTYLFFWTSYVTP